MLPNRGRGLGSLLSDSELVVSQKVAAFKGVKELELDKIQAGAFQPRTDFDETAIRELAESIKVHGIIQPITVRELEKDKFEIISGERRYRAALKAGLTKVPAYIRDVDDQRSLEMALIENIQRENLNPIEIALSYQRMINECNLLQEELGGRVGKNRTTVNNYLRLLQLPAEIQTGLILGLLSVGQARPLITLEDKLFQIELYKRIIEQDLSARKVEQLVKEENTFEREASALDRYREDMRIEEITLKGKTLVPIKINISDIEKGHVSIKFSNDEQLETILRKLESIKA
ncbi:ParB/RepB/Spo0J family partition protein [Emticicia sp. CRIBPO]|uniref:ParB/RepB/Spo0J family partition protein n=1 Tax=Emticicia sp. CRIBPO TaxID=2683258 RepID=UPI001412CEEA|nr:ParB/RepB/Spo0J family partition protein [Emticicia sp. CRIBPO]NBA89059.1 ParB/RepB/Spo0J family partition protein [Emticicia sp. CRIBPO]